MKKSRGSQRDSALARPMGVDPKWREKIAAADQARKLGLELRKDKSPSFRHSVGRVS